MKKILVLMTGGTIGCYSDNGIISLKKNNCRAVELFQEKFPDSADFEIIQPLNILSENLEKSHWETHLVKRERSVPVDRTRVVELQLLFIRYWMWNRTDNS